jgi:C4-dicarboxylate transporter DctM subunit
MGIETLIFALIILILFLANAPIGFALAISGFVYMFLKGYPLIVIAQSMYGAVDSFTLLAVPYFMLCGTLMARGGLSRRLVDFASILVGRFPGALAMSTSVASAMFGAISGSATATTAAIGSITLPGMVNKGYNKKWAAALAAASGTLGVQIPPSIPLVLYGAAAGVSIGGLFLGGIIPGILMMLGFMALCFFHSKKTQEGLEKIKYSRSHVLKSFFEAIPAIGMPVIILGGVFGGFYTATEAGAIASVYGLIVGLFVYRELKLKDLLPCFMEAALLSATIMFILAGAGAFGWVITAEQIPLHLIEFLFGLTGGNKLLLLLLLNVLLLILGTFVETCALIIMLTPIIVPVLNTVGIDLLHFGVVMVVNLAIGMITPPLGVCLFVACNLVNITVADISQKIAPFVAVSIIVLLLITYIPSLVTFIPTLIMK